jgi:hypothetical protein
MDIPARYALRAGHWVLSFFHLFSSPIPSTLVVSLFVLVLGQHRLLRRSRREALEIRPQNKATTPMDTRK